MCFGIYQGGSGVFNSDFVSVLFDFIGYGFNVISWLLGYDVYNGIFGMVKNFLVVRVINDVVQLLEVLNGVSVVNFG